jgi:D-tyrosyl-tRNA(Tyr) deacylase
VRAVVQRVDWANVRVGEETVGEVGLGMCVLLGVSGEDTDADVTWMAEKIATLRIFEDAEGKLNRSLGDVGGSMLVISQFTLYGDCRKGRRPSFTEAAPPEKGKSCYELFCRLVEEKGIPVSTGIFRADMRVSLCNNGPVTMIIDSKGVF